jgi:hypothetical protein
MNGCKQCEGPERPFWPPCVERPQFERIEWTNWVELAQCIECGRLWSSFYYEPYASFIYKLPWNQSIDQWRHLVEENNGISIYKWTAAWIVENRKYLNSEDQAAMRTHIRRNYGHDPFATSDTKQEF